MFIKICLVSKNKKQNLIQIIINWHYWSHLLYLSEYFPGFCISNDILLFAYLFSIQYVSLYFCVFKILFCYQCCYQVQVLLCFRKVTQLLLSDPVETRWVRTLCPFRFIFYLFHSLNWIGLLVLTIQHIWRSVGWDKFI